MLPSSTTTRSDTTDFTRLYEAHVDFVWRSVLRLGVPVSELEDATQETFVVVYRKRHCFEGRSSLRSWIHGIARRIAFRHRRTARRRERRHRAYATRPEPTGLEIDEWVDRRRACAVLEEFLATLSAAQRQAFILGDIEGLSRRELGNALGLNPNTAYSRLNSARKAFERQFGKSSTPAALLESVRQPEPNTRRKMRGAVLAAVGNPGLASFGGLATKAIPAIGSSTVTWTLGLLVAGSAVAILVGSSPQEHTGALPPRRERPVVSHRPPDLRGWPSKASADNAPNPTLARFFEEAEPPSESSNRTANPRLRSRPAMRPSPPSMADHRKETPSIALESEQRLLEQAHLALERADFDRALALAEQHERLHPDGQLVGLRRAVRIIALCRSGKKAQGRAEARVHRRGTQDVYTTNIERACRLNNATILDSGSINSEQTGDSGK